LQLVLQLEYTQVAFYEQALRDGGLTRELHDFAQTVLGHERAHLVAIQKALGVQAGPKPTFRFGAKTTSADAFVRAATHLEDIAVAGYNGQAANLTRPTLAAAAEIVSVEARHAAWIRALAGEVAAPDPVDKPMTARQVAQGLHEIGLRA
jgi:rubrerythrin